MGPDMSSPLPRRHGLSPRQGKNERQAQRSGTDWKMTTMRDGTKMRIVFVVVVVVVPAVVPVVVFILVLVCRVKDGFHT